MHLLCPFTDHAVPAEYAPLAVRTRSAALATATNCKFPLYFKYTYIYVYIYADNIGIFTFLVVEITPVSIAEVGYRTYIYFASISPPSWIPVFFADYTQSSISASCPSFTSSTPSRATSPWNRSTGYSPARKYSCTGMHLWAKQAMLGKGRRRTRRSSTWNNASLFVLYKK